MKYKIIAMDFDGTLLTSNKKITKKTKNTLKRLKNNNYIIVGITARNLLSAKNVLDVNLFDYIILNNGSDIYYVKEDKLKSISFIEESNVKEIYNLYKNKSYRIDFCTPYTYIIKSTTKNDTRKFVKYIDSFDEVDGPISRMNIFFKDIKELNKNKEYLENKFNSINVVNMIDTDNANSKIWLTINPKSVNKLITLKIICDELKFALNDVLFFGDGENDIVLIENVGMGIAMDNALDIVKGKASYVTLSNDKDGIVEYLEKNNY